VKPIIHFQALNEVANFGEWILHYESGDSTLTQSQDASYPYRGKYGLRLTCVNNNEYAEVRKTGLNISVVPGGSVFVCFAHRFITNPSANAFVIWGLNNDSNSLFKQMVLTDGKIEHIYYSDSSSYSVVSSETLTGDWHWVCIELQRATSSTASDGVGRMYVDGVLNAEKTGIDNYDSLAVLDGIRVGGIYNTPPNFVMDFDEVVVADKMVRPPLPAGKVWK